MALMPLFPLRTSEAIDRRQIDLRTFPLEYSIQKTLISHIKIQLELLDGQ